MRFKFITITESIKKKERLFYLIDDYSFDMDPSIREVGYDLLINYINLLFDPRDCVAHLSGFCPYGTWIKANYQVPLYKEGKLKVQTQVEPGCSYRINNEEWSIYINEDRWVCIGNPNISENAVEFLHNCIAVINHENLVALWLKPDFIGDFKKITNFELQK